MARSNELPGFRQKRKILFGKGTTPEQMLETGRRFMQAERYYDALEFFSRSEAEQEVRELVRLAVERGDTPLLLRAKVVLKEEPTAGELRQVAHKAREAGRLSMALLAYSRAGDEQEAEKLRAELGLNAPAGQAEEAESSQQASGEEG